MSLGAHFSKKPKKDDFVWSRSKIEGLLIHENRLEDIMEKEHLEKRFGVLAVEKGYVTPYQVIEALKIQVTEDMEKSKHRPIGVILSEQGLLTTSQLIDVLESMGKSLP
jgi:hypothetical protein